MQFCKKEPFGSFFACRIGENQSLFARMQDVTIPTDALYRADQSTIITAEASGCGFKPGEWPESFETTTPDGWTCTYRKARAETHEGELVAMIYTTLKGEPAIHILND